MIEIGLWLNTLVDYEESVENGKTLKSGKLEVVKAKNFYYLVPNIIS